MDALIAELEAATEGSRELDVKIAWAVHGEMIEKFKAEREKACQPSVGLEYRPTRSLDAARELAPEDVMWAVGDGRKGPWAKTGGNAKSYAATPELAFCVAALKALQAIGGAAQ